MLIHTRISAILWLTLWCTTVVKSAEPTHWAIVPVAGDLTSGDVLGPGSTARFKRISALGAGLDGSLLILDSGALRLKKMSPDGTVTLLAGSGIPGTRDGSGAEADFNNPVDLAVATDGLVYVLDAWPEESVIRRIDSLGAVSTIFRLTNSISGPLPGYKRLDRLAAAGSTRLRSILETAVTKYVNRGFTEIHWENGVASIAEFPIPRELNPVDLTVSTSNETVFLVQRQDIQGGLRPTLVAVDPMGLESSIGSLDKEWHSSYHGQNTYRGVDVTTDAEGTLYASQGGTYNLIKRIPVGKPAETILSPTIALGGLAPVATNEIYAMDGTRVLRLTAGRTRGIRAGAAGGGGVVYIEPLDQDRVRVRAEPNAGFTFMEWTGDVAGGSPTLILSGQGDLDFKAVFGTTVRGSSQGFTPCYSADLTHLGLPVVTVTVQPQLTLYPYGTEVTVKAVPGREDSFFSSWEDLRFSPGPFSALDPVRIHRVTEPLEFIANSGCVALISMTVDVQGSVGGTAGILPLDPGAPLAVSGFFKAGTQIKVAAYPAPDYVFDRWLDGSEENPRTLNLTERRSLTAIFRFIGVWPALFSSDRSVLVPLGGRVELKASALGSEPLTFHWQHDGQLIPNVSGASLTIPAAAVSDGGFYQLTSSNRFGVATLSFYVEVATRFRLEARPEMGGLSVGVIPDQPVVFEFSPDFQNWRAIGLPLEPASADGQRRYRWEPTGDGFLRARTRLN